MKQEIQEFFPASMTEFVVESFFVKVKFLFKENLEFV